MKKKVLLISLLMAWALMLQPSMAFEIKLFGEPLDVSGYMTQQVGISLRPNHYDTENDLQSSIYTLFLEGKYTPSTDLKFYVSSKLTGDWMYYLKHDDQSWNDQLFGKSRDRLAFDHKYWQILSEAHVTWSSAKTLLRVGKQIVSWGQTDGFRLMDQINPIDLRRGFSDVTFENTIIPIWLVRGDYFTPIQTSWLTSIGVQLIFNPNADFIPNQSLGALLGNDVSGIWAANTLLKGPFPGGKAHIGSTFSDFEEPDKFNPEGFEYGAKIEGVVYDAVVTLNFFYGRSHDPVFTSAPIPPVIGTASDGLLLIHPFLTGKYPRFGFVGGTFTRDIPFFRILGSVSPVLRVEALYAYENSLNTSINTIEKHDEFRGAVGLDWKIKIPFLNPKSFFLISPQIYYRRIFDVPTGYFLADVATIKLEKNNYTTTLLVTTSYLNGRLSPSVFWMHDITNRADFYKLELAYQYTHNWRFAVGAMFFTGKEGPDTAGPGQPGESFWLFKNKGQFYLSTSYRWF